MTAEPAPMPLAEAICRAAHEAEWQQVVHGALRPGPRPGGACWTCQVAASVARERGAW